MKATTAYVIGIRVDPGRVDPEWYTLWLQDEDGPNRIVTQDGRMKWASTVQGARALFSHLDGEVTIEPELDGVCDIATTLFEVANMSLGKEGLILNCLNLLDDMLITLSHPLPADSKLRLDRVSGRLTEGVPLPEVVSAQGGAPVVLEAVLASVGRVFVWSDFSPAQ